MMWTRIIHKLASEVAVCYKRTAIYLTFDEFMVIAVIWMKHILSKRSINIKTSTENINHLNDKIIFDSGHRINLNNNGM